MDFTLPPSFTRTATILATGCSGFLGRHCAEALLRHGLRVHAVSRTHRGDSPPTDHLAQSRPPDAGKPAEDVIATLRPSHPLRLAWVTAPDRYRYAAENLDWLEASVALVKAFGEHGGQRFVGVGSSAEYGLADGPCLEDATPINPVSLYGRCKAAVWMTTQPYAQHNGFSAAWARVFLPYGPGDEPRRLIPSVAGRADRRQTDQRDRRQPDLGISSTRRISLTCSCACWRRRTRTGRTMLEQARALPCAKSSNG